MRFLVAAILAIAVLAGPVSAQGDTGQAGQDEMMKAYEEAAKPGQEHAMLAKTAGRWNCQVKNWMDPNAEPMVSEGTEESEMIFGGRYLRSHFRGNMMGQSYEGMGTIGYDKGKKKFVGTWFDSMSTGIMSYEGDYNPDTKELVCRGSFVNPVTGQTENTRMVSRFVSDDQHIFEMWGPSPDGKEMKWMEITYNRAG